MALQFLLDEHISPDVAAALERLRTGVHAVAMRDWRDGAYLGMEDDLLIAAAYEDRLTLVTYDRRTIVPLLSRLAAAATPHGGVVFVDERSIAPNDIGGLSRALAALWDHLHSADWTVRVIYLVLPEPLNA